MIDLSRTARLAALTKPPIAISFLQEPPAGVERWQDGAVPAGCTFWRKAMEGRTFYTVPADHYHCAVGAYTHQLPLPAESGTVLQDTIGFMVSNGYIQMAEVPSIPVLAKTPAYVAYGPVTEAPFRPDVVLLAARPYSAMLVYEAALRAGAGNALTHAIGRPGCAVLPLTQQSTSAALSFGCKGNRTFTGLPDEELYLCIPGERWPAVLEQLEAIASANSAMEQYYREHQAQFPILPS